MSATRELPAPRGCPSLPQSSWQCFGDTNVPTKLCKHTETQESCGILGTFGRTSAFETHVRNFYSSNTIWHLSQVIIFAGGLAGYEEDVSSIRDGFSAWVKADPETILKRHLFDAKGANPAFREAPVREHSPSNEEYRFDIDVPNRLTEPKRLSIYNWNPGP